MILFLKSFIYLCTDEINSKNAMELIFIVIVAISYLFSMKKFILSEMVLT